ncbi:hypothetical protein IJ096_01475 [Candidatus Saccharibacteria bacterium]|nr:hypothetical protein [Candidatus Saccharibacteria bacterium]
MGIVVTKKDDNSKLNQRITADLRSRAAATTDIDSPDLVEDSDYSATLKKTSRFGWVWIVLIVLAIASIISIVAF